MANANSNVISLDLRPEKAKQILKEVVKAERVFFTTHIRDRMVERSITRKQVLRCLEHGLIIEGPYREPGGNWKMNLETVSAGDRIVTVAVLDRDESGNFCLTITVF